MSSVSIEFLKYLVRLRDAFTHDTPKELEYLSALAKGKRCIIEVGVSEGVASSVICQSMAREGKLYLIDPYFWGLKIEKILKFSTSEFIARRAVKKWKSQVEFVKNTSVSASQTLDLQVKADLIFIDARHDYKSVLEDFNCWSPLLSSDGVIAFHDSRICEARPDLDETVGPVKLCNEIAHGEHGNWKIVGSVDSITVISKFNANTDA